jgi:hypothetical protein
MMNYRYDLTLEETGILALEDLDLLAEYNIETLEQLLGATNGLQNIEIFNEMDNKNHKIDSLLKLVPQIILEKYRRFEDKKTRGLLLDGEEAADLEDDNERE